MKSLIAGLCDPFTRLLTISAMKAMQLHIGIVLLLVCLLGVSAAQEQQLPFIDDSYPVSELPEVIETLHDAEDPPPPIWSLCGNPSKHLLIPYAPFYHR